MQDASPQALPPRSGGKLPPGTPYCAACGYELTGVTESSRCPECGQPLVEVLSRVGAGGVLNPQAKRYRSTETVFGLPWIDVALGARPEFGERLGKARGFIAIGDSATGFIALGGKSVGVVSFGGLSIGVFSFGGLSLGVLGSAGGLAIAAGGLAVGGGAIGGLAAGGGALGFVASGGGAIGYYAYGGGAGGVHVINATGKSDPEAKAVFDQLSWLMPAPIPANMSRFFFQPAGICIGAGFLAAAVLLVIGLAFRKRGTEDRATPAT